MCSPARVQPIDPATPETWPADVHQWVSQLARRCRDDPQNHHPRTPSYELGVGSIDATYDAEARFRDLLGERPVALFHATRLLLHEVEAIQHQGLLVLDEHHRSERLDRVIDLYGDTLGVDRLGTLRSAGPLSWDRHHREARLGTLHGVTPLDDAFKGAGHGMEVFLENWGGESFYWAQQESPDQADVIADLTSVSSPAIIEVAVQAHTLNDYRLLWAVFVGQLDGWSEPWHEFSTRTSIAPDRVVEIIRPENGRWPLP